MLLAADALAAYPNDNCPFNVYTDAFDYQMGIIIIQDNQPVVYGSRKLNGEQKNTLILRKNEFQ